MPAFDAFFLARPGARSNAFDRQPQDFSDPPSAGEDFDSLMQARLASGAPPVPVAPGKITPRPDKNPAMAPVGKSLPAAAAPAPAVSTSGKSSAANAPAAKANGQNPASPAVDTPSPQTSAAAPEPMPLFIALPPFFGGALVQITKAPPAAETSGAASLDTQTTPKNSPFDSGSGWPATILPLAGPATLPSPSLAQLDSPEPTPAPFGNLEPSQPPRNSTAVPTVASAPTSAPPTPSSPPLPATLTDASPAGLGATSASPAMPNELDMDFFPRATGTATRQKNAPASEPPAMPAPQSPAPAAQTSPVEPQPAPIPAAPALLNNSDVVFFPLTTANPAAPGKNGAHTGFAVSTTPAPTVDVPIKSDAKSDATPALESPANSPVPVAATVADNIFRSVTAGDSQTARPDTHLFAATEIPPAGRFVNSAGDTAAAPIANDAPQLPAATPTATPAAGPAGQAPDSDLPLSLLTAAENSGTGVAIMASSMKNSQNTIKVAGLDAKVLPVGENGDAKEKNLPTQVVVAPARGTENRGTDLNFTFSGNSNHTIPTPETPVLNAADLPSLADARLRALDRTHDMMALHTMRLVESKSDTLSVVIKPGVGTELSLELRQRGDSVEAQATLLRGDHQFLSQNWRELQQRLEQRGIKLAPLGGEADFSAAGNSQFQQQPQPSQEEAAQQASAFAEFAAAGPVGGGASARMATVHDGWESWA